MVNTIAIYNQLLCPLETRLLVILPIPMYSSERNYIYDKFNLHYPGDSKYIIS